MECEYCYKILSSKSALKTHQTKAKYCLQKQNKIFDTSTSCYTCEYCQKSYIHKHKYNEHMISCKERDVTEKQQMINKITELNNTIMELRLENERLNLRLENERLKGQQDIYKEDHKHLIEMAKQPKTTNNNSRNIVFTNSLNLDQGYIQEAIDNNLTLIHVQEGQKGVAKFVVDNLLITDSGEMLYKCRDVSRRVCCYMDFNGDIIKDVNTEKLRKAIVPGIKTKASNISKNNYIDDVNHQEDFYSKYVEIQNLDKEADIFSKTIAEMTCH